MSAMSCNSRPRADVVPAQARSRATWILGCCRFSDRISLIGPSKLQRKSWDNVAIKAASAEDLLVRNFNEDTVADLMCTNTVNVGWDGKMFLS